MSKTDEIKVTNPLDNGTKELFDNKIWKHKVFNVYVKTLKIEYIYDSPMDNNVEMIVSYRGLDNWIIKTENITDFMLRFEKVGVATYTDDELINLGKEWSKE